MTAQPFASIVDVLFDWAASRSDEIAYRFHGGRGDAPQDLAVGSLARDVRAVAAALTHRGLKGERVVLALPHAPVFMPAFFGCLAAGALAAPVPMQRAGKEDPRFNAVLADAAPALVIADAAAAPALAEIAAARHAAFGGRRTEVTTLDALLEDPDAFAPFALGADDVAVLQYTSGSTGDPKGVMVTHGNIVDNVAMIIAKLRIRSDSRGVVWLPFYHDMGLVGAVLVPMAVRGMVDLITPQSFVQAPMAWLQKLSDVRATTAVAPNFALERCCDLATPEALATLDLSSIGCLLTGSEPVNPNTLERFAATFAPAGFRRDAIMPAYGLAEATLLATGNLHDGVGPTIRAFDGRALAANRAAAPTADAPVRQLVGNGAPEGRVRIADPETGRGLSDGTVGEIWITGGSVAKGYFNRPDVTAAAFGARLADAPGEGPFYRTGDLGFVVDDDLFITGRLKDLIIVRGRNVYPQDVEETATRGQPALATGAAAAFAVDRGRGEEVVLAAEATRQGVTALKDPDAAEALVADVLARVSETHEIAPIELVVVKPGRLPRTSSGKIRRSAALAEWQETGFEPHVVHRWSRPATPTSDAAEAPLAVASRAELEDWLIARLAAQSGRPAHEIDLDEPFASYGLDSVTAIELVAAVNRLEIGARKVDPTDLYDHPTVKRLLDYMFEGGASAQPHGGAGLADEAAALRALLDV